MFKEILFKFVRVFLQFVTPIICYILPLIFSLMFFNFWLIFIYVISIPLCVVLCDIYDALGWDLDNIWYVIWNAMNN